MQQNTSRESGAIDADAPTTVLGSGSTHGPGFSSQPAPSSGPTAAPSAPQTEREVKLLRLRRHGRRLILPVFVLIGCAIAAGYWVGRFGELWQNLIVGIGITAVAMLLGLGPILAWSARRTIITDRRIISYRGVLSRTRTELSLARVREVRSRQNPVQRLWRSGDLVLLIGAESRRISDSPDILTVQEVVQLLVEENYEAAVADTGARQGSFFG